MRLNSPLVTSFLYNDKEYALNLSFDNVLTVFDVLEDKRLRDYERARISLKLLTGESFEGMEAVELWNYVYESFIQIKSKKTIEYDLKGNPMPTQEEDDDEERYLDLEQDADLIYSSFEQAYNINLIEQQGKIHWSQFKALLNGLPSNTIMQQVIQIRSWKPSKGDSKEHKENMQKLQKIHALHDAESEEVD